MVGAGLHSYSNTVDRPGSLQTAYKLGAWMWIG